MTAQRPGSSGIVADLQEALDVVLARCDGPIALSPAGRQSVRAALVGRVTRECPVVRGRTVWSATDAAVAVVESPNRYGRLEAAPAAVQTSILVTLPGAPLPSWEPDAVVLEKDGAWRCSSSLLRSAETAPDFSIERRDYETATKAARVLAKKLAQFAGVHLAYGMPESPVFVVVTPRPVGEVSNGVGGERDGISTDPMVIPGLPGSLRVGVTRKPRPGEMAEYVERFSAAVSRRRPNGTP